MTNADSAESDREEAIREVLGAVRDGDIEPALHCLSPEIEWYPPSEGTLDAVFRGHDGVRRLFGLLFDSWAQITHEVSRITVLDNHALVIADLILEGRQSHVEINEEWGYVTEFDGARIRTARMYTTAAAARDAFEAAI